jgi:hypothetical protein
LEPAAVPEIPRFDAATASATPRDRATAVTEAIKLVEGAGQTAAGIYSTGESMEAILNSSFDWNGIREPFVFATENDSLNGVVMLFGRKLPLSRARTSIHWGWRAAPAKRPGCREVRGKSHRDATP